MKPIRTSADLAINGAAPAFDELLHVGRPNIGDKQAFLAYVDQIFERRWLSNDGPLLQEFEARVAAHLGVRHCVAMCNGTIALEIAIRATGMEGEVIVPSYTFVATAHALQWQGITPVFADIDPATHTLDPEAVRSMITPRTTGIIGVHLWGRAAPVEALQALADERGLKLLYDSAHAFSCSHGGRMIGNFGDCEVLSFHATKFFNSFEGGAVVTNDDELANRMRLMRNFGFSGLDQVSHPGTNGKMIEIAAAMGLVNLDAIDRVIGANRANHDAYRAALAGIPGVKLIEYDPNERNNYQYVIAEVGPECAATRDAIVDALRAEHIMARRYFWPGCHKMEPYRSLFPHAGLVLPATERVAASVMVLPTGETMDAERIATVAQVIRTVVGSAAGHHA
ncbi:MULTISPECIES: DegT/DnrJ/EryC1/StrS family aminotransferase [Massilia]|uniref:dTDP-4-dehydro-6-deoxyglucose aminotransferase n=1 Tax=Massilia aurea TaxID=373040 RepID=A0A422QML0_9BURK|nr:MULTISPECIES: DegT/DnrJ/EryC1/StrS family aminotransferase [Massilia]MDY0965574.1 DegT/DnrJ/EryC1/StrS family aminotransferase [Massilia sp. CFBP9026]RNF31208.1 dTDP-4-dehydro-6-deoxyglucose aminotransferase [Massilia aurea]